MKILWLGLEHSIGIEDTHEVCIMNKDNFDIEKAIAFAPDIVMEREFNDGKHIWDAEIQNLKYNLPKLKSAVWLIDTHVQYDRHMWYAQYFDYIFLAISKYVPEFKKHFTNVFWLPLCFPLSTLPQNQKDLYPIGFVGRKVPEMTKRLGLLARIEEHYGKLCHFVTDYANPYKTMAECTIMVNQSFAEDMNFRVFEALACGNILVTNWVPDLDKIAGLKDRIFVFNSPQGAVFFIDEILKADKQSDIFTRIEDNRRFIAGHHLLKHRALKMIEVITNGGEDETLSY